MLMRRVYAIWLNVYKHDSSVYTPGVVRVQAVHHERTLCTTTSGLVYVWAAARHAAVRTAVPGRLARPPGRVPPHRHALAAAAGPTLLDAADPCVYRCIHWSLRTLPAYIPSDVYIHISNNAYTRQEVLVRTRDLRQCVYANVHICVYTSSVCAHFCVYTSSDVG